MGREPGSTARIGSTRVDVKMDPVPSPLRQIHSLLFCSRTGRGGGSNLAHRSCPTVTPWPAWPEKPVDETVSLCGPKTGGT